MYTPGPSARNALTKNTEDTWTETQPDGYKLIYDTTGTLTHMQGNAKKFFLKHFFNLKSDDWKMVGKILYRTFSKTTGYTYRKYTKDYLETFHVMEKIA